SETEERRGDREHRDSPAAHRSPGCRSLPHRHPGLPNRGESSAALPARLRFRPLLVCRFSGRLNDLADSDTEVVVEHEHLAASHGAIVYVNVHRVAREFVEFHDRALAEAKDVFHEHARAAKFYLHMKVDILQQVDAVALACLPAAVLAEGGQIE